MKAFMTKAAVGLVWFVGFSIVTKAVVRPVLVKVSAAAGVPQLGNIL